MLTPASRFSTDPANAHSGHWTNLGRRTSPSPLAQGVESLDVKYKGRLGGVGTLNYGLCTCSPLQLPLLSTNTALHLSKEFKGESYSLLTSARHSSTVPANANNEHLIILEYRASPSPLTRSVESLGAKYKGRLGGVGILNYPAASRFSLVTSQHISEPTVTITTPCQKL